MQSILGVNLNLFKGWHQEVYKKKLCSKESGYAKDYI